MLNRFLPAAALAVASTGCSLAFVDGPPDYVPANEPVPIESCTIDRTLPLLDAIGAGAFLVTTLTSSDGNEVRISALVGGALGFSSFTGLRRVGNCRERVLGGVEESSSLVSGHPEAATEIGGPLVPAARPLTAIFPSGPKNEDGETGGRAETPLRETENPSASTGSARSPAQGEPRTPNDSGR